MYFFKFIVKAQILNCLGHNGNILLQSKTATAIYLLQTSPPDMLCNVFIQGSNERPLLFPLLPKEVVKVGARPCGNLATAKLEAQSGVSPKRSIFFCSASYHTKIYCERQAILRSI